MPLLSIAALILAPAPSPTLFATPDNAGAVAAIQDEGRNRNQVMRTLRDLTSNVGARVTGSPQYTKAEAWSVAKFKGLGLENVHLEKWGEVPIGFSRGPANRDGAGARDLTTGQAIAFSTPCWAPGTRGAVRADAVPMPKTPEEAKAVRGKWVLMAASVSMRGITAPKDDQIALLKAIDDAGPAGKVYGATSELLHTHGRWTRADGKPKTMADAVGVPTIYVKKSDFARITAQPKPRLEFNLDHVWTPGPIAVHNVVAEIRGSEKPDEVVILGGHFDSWNAPGSQGATDNGTGVSSVLEAARLLKISGAKPKRTIRFVLFGGEEQGLYGSTGYVAAHKEEMDKISAVFIEDGGTNSQGSLQGLASMRPILERAMSTTNEVFPAFPIVFREVPEMGRGGGSDHTPFLAAGVPGFYLGKAAGQKVYAETWHTQNDRYERAVPKYLAQCSTNMALLALGVADAESMIPRK